MKNENNLNQYHAKNILRVLSGLLVGGLAGAGTMLLFAPQSGKKTRKQIQEKGNELRDQTTGVLDEAMAKAWLAKNKITRDGRRKANELIHQSTDLLTKKIDHVTGVAKTWKKENLSS